MHKNRLHRAVARLAFLHCATNNDQLMGVRATRSAAVFPPRYQVTTIENMKKTDTIVRLARRCDWSWFWIGRRNEAGKTGFRTLLGADPDTVEALQRSRRLGADGRR